MVLQIEKIGKDTFDRVVYRFPLWGGFQQVVVLCQD